MDKHASRLYKSCLNFRVNIAGTPYPSFIKGRGVVILKFPKKDGGGGGLEFSHKKGGVGKIGRLF